ncbi:M43 family zinc metalloprotease [Flavobacterium suncheonense]|uniref:PKD domain-containing protein n=1 Tax=Flavobacterium suncheonense GH29-5 = DSM 17707 TaxID=1121899 RepID=A0A0A2MG80_9FLAO|nr:M43 family zinc metalloprotease [Flavobacterium suncheonense]KGO90473.1 hypothetical protein Q764_02665 [Flavobacterium suncheonense GH29-5 = DSM 17707]
MKKLFFFFLNAFLIVSSYSQKTTSSAGEGIAPCGTDYLHEKSIKENPNIVFELEELEKIYKKEYEKVPLMKSGSYNITIPVVFYVVHDGGTSNIPDSQVQSQLTALNSYFSPHNINFCLATKLGASPTLPTVGNSVQTTPGIIHVLSSTLANHNINTAASQQALITGTAGYNITSDKFLRIWIVKDILDNNQPTGILGYAPVPLTTSLLDGIVVKYNTIGNAADCPNCLTNYNQGKTLIHEVGHYFGLYHTFHEGCQGSESGTCLDKGDKVCDTPQSSVPMANCNTVTNSCPENADNDDLSNFMGYTVDPCKDHFTQGQADRMFAVLSSFRSVLFSTENLVDVGACSANLISSAINPSSYLSCTNNTITFSSPYTSTSQYSYIWDFGDPSSPNNIATTPSAAHSYQSAANSPYTVTLTVTRNSDNVSSTSTKKIYITACQPIQSSQGTWIVSSSNLLKFNTGVPVFDPGFPNNQIINPYTIANQNDSNGNLLFFTDKTYVYNNTPSAINTTPIALDPWQGRGFSTLILPKPNSTDKYYIFSNTIKTTVQSFNDSHGFRFSEIQENSGNISMNSIRQPIFDSAMGSFFQTQLGAFYNGSGITAIKKNNSQNEESYWILTTLKGVDNKTYIAVFLFDNISGIKYHSHYLSPLNIETNLIMLEASPNGNKIFMYNPNWGSSSFILDFNKAQGIINNPKLISYDPMGINESASFSPDSNLLYYIEAQRRLYQVNLNSTDPDQTKILVATENYPKVLGQMQLGPDGKIYIDGTYSDCLKVIHNPNNLCTTDNYNNCNYYFYGPKKNPGGNQYLSFGLPNMIDAQQSTAYINSTNSISHYLEGCNTYKFFPDYYGQSFSWDFGDIASGSNNTSTAANPTHTFTVGNDPQYTFTVTLKNSSGTVIAQKQIVINNTTNTITGSSDTCADSGENITNNFINLQQGQSVIWTITGGSGTIQGSNDQENVLVAWTQLPGILKATITNEFGCQKEFDTQILENCCPVSLVFSNTETGSSVVYNASDNIVTNNNYSVNSGIDVSLKAGSHILLQPDSHIKSGAVFLARIENCDGTSNRYISALSEKNNPPRKPHNYNFIKSTSRSTQDNEINGLNVYPNPANSFLYITTAANGVKNITIYDVVGKEVLNTTTANETINVSSLNAGIYMVKITEEGKTATRKLVIQ